MPYRVASGREASANNEQAKTTHTPRSISGQLAKTVKYEKFRVGVGGRELQHHIKIWTHLGMLGLYKLQQKLIYLNFN